MMHLTPEKRRANRQPMSETTRDALTGAAGRFIDRFFAAANLPLVPRPSVFGTSALGSEAQPEPGIAGSLNDFMSAEGIECGLPQDQSE